jgi:hypothetical protein
VTRGEGVVGNTGEPPPPPFFLGETLDPRPSSVDLKALKPEPAGDEEEKIDHLIEKIPEIQTPHPAAVAGGGAAVAPPRGPPERRAGRPPLYMFLGSLSQAHI